MKKNLLKSLCAIIMIIATATATTAQTSPNIPDDELKGVWIYTSYKAGNITFDNDFPSIKIYGENGEYCCAQVCKLRSGAYKITPHAYGVYIYRNGEYTECGRKGDLNLTSPTNFHGSWMGRTEYWEKATNFPSELRDYIMSECKKSVLGDDKEYQELIDKHWINREK